MSAAVAYFSTNTELGLINALTQSLTVYLPQTPNTGKSLFLKDAAGTSVFSTITVATQGIDTFEDGSTRQYLNNAYESMQLVYNSNKWYITGGTMFNTMTVSSLTTQVVSTNTISSLTASFSTLKMVDQLLKSTSGTLNTISSILYYNNNIVGGGLRNAISQNLYTYISSQLLKPNNISNLSYWFDASVSTSMIVSTNSTVLLWNTMSTVNRFFVSTPINSITTTGLYIPNSLNGLGGVNLSTTNLQSLNLSNFNYSYATARPVLDSEYTTFCLINRLATGYPAANVSCIYMNQFGGNNRIGSYVDHHHYLSQDGIASHLQVFNYTQFNCNLPIIACYTRQGSITTVRSNGKLIVTSNLADCIVNNALGLCNVLYIGTDSYGEYFSGNFHELIQYNTYLTLTDIQRVEGYLAWKWLLQSSLPTSHPYRWIPPY